MLLDKNIFFVKERMQFFKFAGEYDILDPSTGQPIGIAREENNIVINLLRLVMSKLMLPNNVVLYDSDEIEQVLRIKKPMSFIRSNVEVQLGDGQYIGFLKSKIFTFGGGFFVHDATGNQIAEIKGDWKGWNFQLLSNDGREIGSVTKKWAGMGKELFTSADNYIISFNEGYTDEVKNSKVLLMAACLAIDIVYKEKN